MYSLAYSDFVMPLVNAVKEQQQQIKDLKKQIDELKMLFVQFQREK
jgi:flagellar biosynthesis chaperone FliJ